MTGKLIEKLSNEDLGIDEFLEEEYIKNKSIPISLVHQWGSLFVLHCLDNLLPELTQSAVMRDILHYKLQWINEGMSRYDKTRAGGSQQLYRVHGLYVRESANDERALITEAAFVASLGTIYSPRRNAYRSVSLASRAVALYRAIDYKEEDLTEYFGGLGEARRMLIHLLEMLQMSRQKMFQLLWTQGQKSQKVLGAWKRQTEDALFGES